MNVDVSKLAFISTYPIDKIVNSDTIIYTVPGPDLMVEPISVVLETIPNSYGKKTFMAASWSTDNTNFYNQTTATYFFVDTFNPREFNFQAITGCDDNNIYFFLQNGLVDGSLNPISQTVTINYAQFLIT